MTEKTQELKQGKLLFTCTMTFIVITVLAGLLFPDTLYTVGIGTMNYLTDTFGYVYIAGSFVFVAMMMFFAFSKYGQIRLGPDDAKPEFSTISWIGLLFSAGMGTVMLYWGVAEPVYHYVNPLVTTGIEPMTPAAASFALKRSFIHQGIQAWASFAVLGLVIGYLMYRKNENGLVSNILLPWGRDKANGSMGKMINIICVFGAIAGISTSLGQTGLSLGVSIEYLFGIPSSNLVTACLVGVIAVITIICTTTGLEGGIRRLSDYNLYLLAGLIILVGLLGPTKLMVNVYFDTLGNYLNGFFSDALKLPTFAAKDETSWISGWPIYYYAWAIAWAPFVGPFIARVSKGRTVKEFILGSLVLPCLGIFIWVAFFGTIGLESSPEVLKAAAASSKAATFIVLEDFPMGKLISFGVVIALFTCFITSLNSSTFVLSSMCEDGSDNPSNKMRTIWVIAQAAMALTLMMGSTSGIELLQSISLIFALPLIFVLFLCLVSTVKMFRSEFSDEAVKEFAEESQPKTIEANPQVA
ncbi:BCCT family transporter [Endozoicomonas sp. OPT23]|uniref:BCCT family transporter n=1 Tax=Endozoicomonas sp. OPT23 TaxID=2072845 RepID=UPI00129A9EF5|nr:BCCT family transporter [Endozoicomonas sp. OPT23]MRI33630.1 BCCT family transporter [Endozoicomonas sp. OPT23]